MHREVSAKFPLVPQLPQGELLQDFTVASSTYPHDAGLLTLIDTCGEKLSTVELRKGYTGVLQVRAVYVWGFVSAGPLGNKLVLIGNLPH